MIRFALISQLFLACALADSTDPLKELAQSSEDSKSESGDFEEAKVGEQVSEQITPTYTPDDLAVIVSRLEKGEINRNFKELLPKDDDFRNFNGGSFLFINISKTKVAVKVGDKEFELDPGQRKMLHPKATHKNGGCQVRLSYQKDEKWKVFRNTRWSTNVSYRSLIFFHQDSSSERLAVTPVVDILTYKPK